MNHSRLIRFLSLAFMLCCFFVRFHSASAESMSASIPALSLPDRLQQVLDLGIADLETLSRAEEICTKEDGIGMLAKVHELRYGMPSKYLSDPGIIEASNSEHTTRYYFAQALCFSAMESIYDTAYEHFNAWIHYCNENQIQSMWPDSQVISLRLDGTVGEGGVWDICADLSDIDNPANANDLSWGLDFGLSHVVNYAMLTYDRTNGKKVLELDDAFSFRPFEAMTVAEVAEAVLRYYHSFEPTAEMIPYADTAAFDSSIITPELLKKETSLPDATCANLPSQWRGVLMFDMGRVISQALDANPDKRIYEHEIQAVKDAGFNFIGLVFDFSVLQGPVPEAGKLNETRLKELDQVIAWCMERDIHVDLRCSSPGGMTKDDAFSDWVQWNHDSVNGTDYAPEFASLWKALAQRYADIPNHYLSFNLMIEPEISSDDQYAAFFGPAVNAIREVTPDRCIIADIHSGGLMGTTMAEMGVALSYHAYDPREFCVVDYNMQNDPEQLHNISWPFTSSSGETYNAAAVLNSPIENSVSANELSAIAKEYGVGFMVGEFGIFTTQMPYHRYSDETLYAYYKDMIDTLNEKGYGWCSGVWHGSYGIVSSYPAVKTAEYEQVGDHAFYLDKTMFNFFQEFNRGK